MKQMKSKILIIICCFLSGCSLVSKEEHEKIRNDRAAREQVKQKKLDSVIGATIVSIEDNPYLLKINLSDGKTIVVQNYKFTHSLDVKDNENAVKD